MSKSLTSKSRFVVRCRRRKCPFAAEGKSYSVSVLKGSIVAHCRFSKAKFVEFCYLWLNDVKCTRILKQLGMSSRTVTDWGNYLREAVANDIENSNDFMIGGPGMTVEIDESKFGKRKYNVSTVSVCVDSPICSPLISRFGHFCRRESVLMAAGCLEVWNASSRGRIRIPRTPFRRNSLMERNVASANCFRSLWRSETREHLYHSSSDGSILELL